MNKEILANNANAPNRTQWPGEHRPLLLVSILLCSLSRIKSAIGTRTLKVRTTGSSKIFYKRFYPSSMESGLFQVVRINNVIVLTTA